MDSPHWREFLDAKQKKEVDWATMYVTEYSHGTTGHNQLLLIARLAALLDEFSATGRLTRPEPTAAADVMLTFGKYSGLTLGEVLRRDADYVRWLADKARDDDIKSAAIEVLSTRIAVARPSLEAPIPGEPGEDVPF